MLTGLKKSSLTCKCGFYRPEQNQKGHDFMVLNFECLARNTKMKYLRIELEE